jgi:hypothetical protein
MQIAPGMSVLYSEDDGCGSRSSIFRPKVHPRGIAQSNPMMELGELNRPSVARLESFDRGKRGLMTNISKAEAERFSQESDPNEIADTFRKKGANAVSRIKSEMRDNFLTVILGSVIASFLAGYFISRQREARTREQWAEILFRQMKDWLSERGRKAAAPVQEGLGYARSAAEQAGRRGAQYGRRLNPFSDGSRRRFLGIL